MENIIEIHNVVKKYSNHTALQDLSLSIPKGVIFGLLGPNGAGKTSLIRIINQITRPDEGYVLFNGEPLSEKHIYKIGYLPEERGLYKKMKVGEQLLYLARIKGLSKDEAMSRLKYWFEKFEIKSWWEKNVEDLSKGMQQKIQFVATVLHQPELIILDEPFSGFDPINANLIKDEILELKANGSTVIFSTHRMESVEELCDNVALIDKSQKVLDGSKIKIKEEFKDNTFTISYEGKIESLIDSFSVINNHEDESGINVAKIRVSDHIKGNELLQALIPQVKILSFKENIPSMNEIFIKVVGKSEA